MKKNKLSQDAQDLLKILRKHARGHNNAMPIKDIIKRYDYRTRKQVQIAKLELLEKGKFPIGSTPGRNHGLFLCKTIKDLVIALGPRHSQINSMRRGEWTLTKSPRAKKILGQIAEKAAWGWKKKEWKMGRYMVYLTITGR